MIDYSMVNLDPRKDKLKQNLYPCLGSRGKDFVVDVVVVVVVVVQFILF